MQPKTKKLLVCFSLVMIFLTKGFAQDKIISGKVLTKDNLGVSGALVQASNSKRATVADSLGNFKLAVTKDDKAVVVSSLGFITSRISLASGNYNFVLAEDPKSLTDVVVTAYGVKKEIKRIGYSVQEIKGADLTKARDANPINSLAGKVAGLSVGANPEMLGRPELVLRGSKDLLYVVDGVPVNTDTWNIAPDDIESYSILKGTNASALYGFRGSNGAIIITTKRGVKGKKGWTVELNSSAMVEKGIVALPQSQYEYGRGKAFVYDYGNRLYDNAQRLPEWGPHFDGQLIRQFDSPWDPVAGVRTPTPWTARGVDNFNKFMQAGIVNTNNIALSAATDKSDIRISFSNMNQKGMGPNTKLNIYNLGVNAGYNLSDKFRVEASLNYNKQFSPNIPDVTYGPNSYIYMFKVYGSSDYNIDDLKDIYKAPQGVPGLMQYAPEYGRENSAWFMADKWFRTHDKTAVDGWLKASYKFTKELSATLRSQVTTWQQTRNEDVPAGANLQTYTPWWYFGWYGDFHQDSRNLFENNTDLILNFDKKYSNFNITALGGASERSFYYNSFWGTTKGLALPGIYNLANSQTPALTYNWGSNMQVYSAFYSVDLTYKKLFTLSHTGRVDNLSTLPAGNNTFYYPSASLSTVVTDYAKLPQLISYLKLRGSVAEVKGGLTTQSVASAFTQVTGNSTNGGLLGYGADLYSSYDGPTYANQMAYSLVSYYNNTASLSYSSTIADPNLKPYTRTSYEGGVDAKFFKNRIGLDFTYFVSNTGPQIFPLGVASSTGFSSVNVNGITTQKKGFELAVNASILKSSKGLNWDLGFNYSTFIERLKSIYGTYNFVTLNGHDYHVGDRLDAYYSTGFVYDGSGNVVYKSGLLMTPPSDNGNKTFLGNLNPDYSFGITNKFSWNNFSLSFQFDGRIGGTIWDEVYKDAMNGGTDIESASGDFGVARLAEWNVAKANGGALPNGYTGAYVGKGVKIVSGTPTFSNGQITNLSSLTFAPNDVTSTVQNFVTGSLTGTTAYWMVDRSFVKLREVVIGYNFPSSLVAKSKYFKSASVSLIGRNLLYFAKRKDIDLDQFPSGYNDADRAQGNGGILQSVTGRRLGININLTF